MELPTIALNGAGIMIKKVSLVTIISVVVASLAIVAIARYQRSVHRGERQLSGWADYAPTDMRVTRRLPAGDHLNLDQPVEPA